MDGWKAVSSPYKHGRKVVVDAVCGCGARGRVGIDPERSLRSKACFACTRKKPTHGHALAGRNTSTYRCWQSIRDRCNNTKAKAYPNYGGRGICVCERWEESFANFLEDMGERPVGLSIGRKDNDGDYEPDNCRWETRSQQNNNTRQNVFLTYRGETKTAAEWAQSLGIKSGSLRFRLRRGMSVEDALTLPIDMAETRRVTQNFETLSYQGETLTVWQWAERTGINRTTLQARKNLGWSARDILNTPVHKKKSSKT